MSRIQRHNYLRHVYTCGRLSAVSVVPDEGYLAYLCAPVADTRSIPVEIARVILAVSGAYAHR